jgi:hypothetical protein
MTHWSQSYSANHYSRTVQAQKESQCNCAENSTSMKKSANTTDKHVISMSTLLPVGTTTDWGKKARTDFNWSQ